MAEVSFFMTHDDTRMFVEFLIREFDAHFALDECATPDPPVLRSADDVSAIVEESEFSPPFFVQSPLWDRYPLVTAEVHTNDGRHFFSINQRHGGPAFNFKVPRCYAEDNDSCIILGWFSDYPWYFADRSSRDDHSPGRRFDRPEEMANAYRAVQKYLQRNGKRSMDQEFGRTGPWILDDALARHSRGLWLRQGDERFVPRKST